MDLKDLGYPYTAKDLENYSNLDDFVLGRVMAEHKERYIVKTNEGEFEAEITGNMRFTAQSRLDFPAVGDWVAIMVYDANLAIIHQIIPRFSVITRQAVGKQADTQVIASNIDYAFLVQAADRDFNMNRLERYLTLCNTSKVAPIIVLTKTDLIPEETKEGLLAKVQERIKNIPVFAISNVSKDGFSIMKQVFEKGKTYCALGSSGVGKSTLLNNLLGKAQMKTDAISQQTNKGRHVTTHRELFLLDNGSIFIDSPGMREVGITDSAQGLEKTFDSILAFAGNCKFSDCTHINETGCAVIEAVGNGMVDKAAYLNYLKMEKERAHFESSKAEKRQKDKAFGKYVKNVKKDIKKLK